MGTVELNFSPLPAHVRTARLVAAAVARRCGVDEALLDEVRLAVGEACSRAVSLHARDAPKTPVRVHFSSGPGRFVIAVRDGWPGRVDAAAPEPRDGQFADGDLGLAILHGLVDDLEIEALPEGAEIRMTWPASGELRR